MLNRLPIEIDPFQLAKEKVKLSGHVGLEEMDRLSQFLAEKQGFVHVDMHFDTDYEGKPFVKGHIKSQLQVYCQRCMQRMNYEVAADFLLALVHQEEEIEQISSEYEPLITHGAPVVLSRMLEDELILNLPYSPTHEISTCEINDLQRSVLLNETKLNAFSVLKNYQPDSQVEECE